MKIAFLANPTVGHTNFLISLAKKAIEMKNDVLFILPGIKNKKIRKIINNIALSIDEKLIKDSIPFEIIKISLFQGLFGLNLAKKKGQDETLFALKVFSSGAKRYTSFLIKRFLENPPDLIVYDYTFFAAIAISEKLSIPRVAIYHSGLPFFEFPIPPIGLNYKYNQYPYKIYQKYYNCALNLDKKIKSTYEKIINQSIQSDFLISPNSNFLNVITQLIETEYPRKNHYENLFFSGPCFQENIVKNIKPIIKKSKEQKLIYISLGTVFNKQPDIFIKIINSIIMENIIILVSAGASYDKLKLMNFKQYVHIERYVSQLEVLKSTDIFITHGGKNSINEALMFGVPMILFPIGGEQEYNANLVEYLKAGINFSRIKSTFTLSDMRNSIVKLLNDIDFKTNLKNIAAKHIVDGATSTYNMIISKL